MEIPGGSMILYRIIRGPVPEVDDFRTLRQLGKPLFDDALRREWSEGRSVYDDQDFTIKRARANNTGLGQFVVPLTLPDDESIEFTQVGTGRSPL